MNENQVIGTEAEYDAALREAAELMDAPSGSREGERLKQLVTLIEGYEAEHWPIEPADLPQPPQI